MPPSLHPTEKVKAYLTVIGITLSLIASLYAGIKTLLQSASAVVTTERLIDHNLAKDAHPPIRDSMDSCRDMCNLAVKRVEELRADQIMTMARLARLVAADAERDARKRAQRAQVVETTFKRLVRQGESLEDAFVDALNEANR